MAGDETSPLQSVVRAAIEATGRTRDALDAELRSHLKTTGKPLWDIERGKSKRPAPDRLRVIERVLRIEPDRLVNLVYPREESAHMPTRSADAGETVGIQKLDLSLSMGPGTFVGDYVEAETVELDLALVRSITRSPPERLKLVTGHGHSMEPTLQGSDMILIDTTERMLARQDGIYWIDLFGAAGLKRLRTIGKGRVLIISDNPAVENQEVDADDLRIDGRAVWFARGL